MDSTRKKDGQVKKTKQATRSPTGPLENQDVVMKRDNGVT